MAETAENTPDGSDSTVRPSLSELFFSFFVVAVIGFGGVMPWARRMIVEERRWMTAEAFNEVFALCQFLPGPNIVNFSIIFGSRAHGARGAWVAIAALMGPPTLLVMVIGALYLRYGDLETLQRILSGVASAACGLILATAVKMLVPIVRSRSVNSLAVVALAFVGVGVMRLPIQWVLLGLVPVSLGLAWRAHR